MTRVSPRKRPRPPTGLGHAVARGSLILLVASEIAIVIPGFDSIRRVRPATRPLSGGHIGSRQQQRRLGFGVAVVSAAPQEQVPATEPFVDDGMFDPRVDYWSRLGRSGVPKGSNLTAGSRNLATTSSDCGTGTSSEACCIECFGLSYCDVLNGYKVEDKYYPGEPTILGSCENFEDRASRLDVFGPAKTFRDTDACREMVADYTCLWWGSENEMYDNRCGVFAQVYPCRSYCVQVAQTCANNVIEWQELCRAIDCPPTDEQCMPGPYTQDPDEACYLYEYHSPLSAATRASAFFAIITTAIPMAACVYFFLF